ncbi:MAG: FAD-dependent oxidoreductase, partial [Gemmataceae bacterium]|nr:FAD-dependent oxidoreductase [Gemmataceae bacterium]
MRPRSIAIVGGGPGGLMTAYRLQTRASVAHRTTIFEATPRIGGKILTKRFGRADARYEAGAAEFYDYTPVGEDALKELVLELGLAVNPMRGGQVIAGDRVLETLDDVRAHLGADAERALRAFDRQARDRISPGEFYHAGEHAPAAPAGTFDAFLTAALPHPRAREYVEHLVHSDLATEPHKTSAEYGLHNYLMNHPAYMHLYSIEGGNELLPRALAARLNATVLLNHPVQSVERLRGGRLRVSAAPGGERYAEDFDFVVIALPQSALNGVEFRGARLREAMAMHADRYDFPAHYLRVTILFDRPFWGRVLRDGFAMLDRFGGCCLYDESSREPGAKHHVLGWLLGGAAAEELSDLGDDELVGRALESLPAALAHGKARVVEAHVHRWVGSVNALPGGRVHASLDRRHRPEP